MFNGDLKTTYPGLPVDNPLIVASYPGPGCKKIK
jgi:hypothetical protein